LIYRKNYPRYGCIWGVASNPSHCPFLCWMD
jgi:hypothetical protein